MANNELDRYLNAERRGLLQIVVTLWDKYAVSSRDLESERVKSLKMLDRFLKKLGYVGVKGED